MSITYKTKNLKYTILEKWRVGSSSIRKKKKNEYNTCMLWKTLNIARYSECDLKLVIQNIAYPCLPTKILSWKNRVVSNYQYANWYKYIVYWLNWILIDWIAGWQKAISNDISNFTNQHEQECDSESTWAGVWFRINGVTRFLFNTSQRFLGYSAKVALINEWLTSQSMEPWFRSDGGRSGLSSSSSSSSSSSFILKMSAFYHDKL